MESCRYVFESIRFDMDAIFSCCNNVRGLYVPVPQDADVNFVMEEYFKKADKILNGISLGNECEGCYKLTNEFLNEHCNDEAETKIKTVYISDWRYCNSDCIYCVHRNEKNNMSHYDILPYLEWLKNNDKLSDGFKIVFGGGEPGILKNMDKILNWAKDTIAPTSHISIMSNMIIYRESYKQLLQDGRLYISCSLDCGNRDLYKKIHNVDCFKVVADNIKKILKYAKSNYQINLKYIFLENYNDNEEALNEFINLAEKLGLKIITFDFDRACYNVGKPIPDKILNLYSLAKSESLKKNLILNTEERTEYMYNQKVYT